MRRLGWAFFAMTFAVSIFATAAPPTAAPPAVFEKENSDKSFTAVVKMVRESASGWEVLFEKQPGFFQVPSGAEFQYLLVESQKDKTEVTVRYEEESRRILTVRADKSGSKGGQNPRGK